MITDKQSYNFSTRTGVFTLAVIGLWAFWCFLMATWPQFFAHSTTRAIARVFIVFIPAVVFYLTGNRRKHILDYFLLRKNWMYGAILGFGTAVLYFSLYLSFNFDFRQGSFHIPTGFAIWFNFILGSPLAEEAFFRGVLLQELRHTLGTTWATIVSAFAFALLHLPQWLILDHQPGIELLSSFATIFIYGIVFALFVNLTRSLWASLIPHWINNFILLAMS